MLVQQLLLYQHMYKTLDFFSHVDPGSTVCVKQYCKKIDACCDQCKILFKGG
jgi:hypothetical protein